ncbi:MAG: hypothetical protein HYR91_15515 [Flavobacteriia bacterium]|nr:hypothetical protein [Flavobacteriia bacterium]
MIKRLPYKNEVSFCQKDSCIKIKGEIADYLAIGIFVFTFLMGIKALTKG